MKTFADRVEALGAEKFPEFSQLGKFTFFLPVDSSFQDLQPVLVEAEVVRGHIVPGHLLFSRPRQRRGEAVVTSQHRTGDWLEDRLDLAVVAAITSSQAGPGVESQTLVGNTRHPRGRVRANILLADIALSNGVLHLIDKPLVLMTRRMTEVVRADSPRYRMFYKLTLPVRDLLQQTRTLLVPTNQALQALEGEVVSEDSWRLHFLPELILEEEIKRHNVSAVRTF